MPQTGFSPLQTYSSSTPGNTPAAGSLINNTVGSELAINIADGKLFYKDSGGSVQVIGWKVRPTTAGGTGLTSFTAGDMMYYASGTAFTQLAIGAANTVMTSSGSAPQWSTGLVLSGDITARGFYASGVFAGTYSDGLVMDYSSPTARFTAGTSDGFAWYNGGISSRTTLMTLSSAGAIGTATWNGSTIGTAYGGTGLTGFTSANNAIYSTSSSVLTAGTLPVAAGGTGLTSLTANYIPYGNNAGAFQSSSNLTYSGTVLNVGGVVASAGWQPNANNTASGIYTGVFTPATNSVAFAGGGNEYGRFNGSGSFLINRTSNVRGSMLEITAQGTGNPGGISIDIAIAGNACYECRFTGSSGTIYYGYWQYNGSAVGSITSTGSVTLYNTTSDQRLKENIVDAGSGLAKLTNVKVRSFDWKTNQEKTDFGVIAQELFEVAPECVTVGTDKEDGSVDKPWAVDTSVLVPAMIKAIQELNTKFDAYVASHP